MSLLLVPWAEQWNTRRLAAVKVPARCCIRTHEVRLQPQAAAGRRLEPNALPIPSVTLLTFIR
jgi:hypothetical protein